MLILICENSEKGGIYSIRGQKTVNFNTSISIPLYFRSALLKVLYWSEIKKMDKEIVGIYLGCFKNQWTDHMGIDPRRLKSQEFMWHLILQMVTPNIQRRSLSATFKRTSGIIKSTLEYFLLITKNDRAQCQVGQYLYTVASWAYKDKKGYHSKFQLILDILGPLIQKLCSDKSESG